MEEQVSGQEQEQQTTETSQLSQEAQTGTTSLLSEQEEPKQPSAEVSYDLKLPEGSKLTKERVDEIAAFARKQGLSPEVAQQVLENEHNAVIAYEQKADDELSRLRDKWVDELKNDPQYGGPNFQKTVNIAKRAFDRYATPGLKEFVKSKFGDNKDLILTFYRIGAQEMEDSLVTSKAPVAQSGPKSVEERLYPNSFKD